MEEERGKSGRKSMEAGDTDGESDGRETYE